MLGINDTVFIYQDRSWTLAELLCRIVDAEEYYPISTDQENVIQEKLDEIRAIITRQADPKPVGPKAA